MRNNHVSFQLRNMHKKKSKSIAKPDDNAYAKAKNTMANTDIQVCGVCWEQEDNSEESTIQWMECDTCKIWIHKACAKYNNHNVYACINCKNAL